MAYDILQSSTQAPLLFFLVASSDHIAGLTGATPTVTISKAGGAFAAPSGAVTEIANGWYKVAGNATDTNTLGPLALHATAASADPCDILVANVTAYNPQDAVHLGLSALPNAAAAASGGLLISGSNAGTTTLAALTVTGSFTISDGLLVARSTSNASAITATGNGTGSGAVFTSGSGATGDGLQATAASTNGNGIAASGAGTKNGITTNGGATGHGIATIGGATSGSGISATATTSGDGITATGIGTTKHGINATGGATTSDGIRATGGGAGNGLNLVAGATGIGMKVAGGATSGAGISVTTTSGDGISSTPTAGNALTLTANGTSKHGLVATGGTAGTSDGIKGVAGTGGVDVRGNLTGNVTGNLSGSIGSVAASGINRAAFATDTGLACIRSGTAQAGASTSITLDAGASASNSFYNNCIVYITSGTGVGQARFITGYVGATKVATVTAWVTNPDNTSVFVIEAFDAIPGATAPTAAQVATAVWQDTTSGDFTVSGSIGKSLFTSGAVPGAAGGLFIAGSNAATTVNLTGNLSGSVGSIGAGGIANASYAADTGQQTIRSGTAQAGASTSITLDAGASATNSFYNNDIVYVTGGTGVGQARFITGYVGSTKVATVTAWSTNPDNTSTFAILPFDAIPGATAPTASQIATAVWQDTTAGDFTVASSIGKSLFTSGAVPGAAGGLFIAGSNAATTVNFTGSLSGSVGSVTGAVGSVTARVTANADQLAGQTVSAAAGVTFPSSVASPTNITAGTITTVTNLTNAPTAGDLTATMKASVTTAATAATPTAAAVTGSVGSVTGSVGSVVGLTASDVGAIKTKTDQLVFTVLNQVDVNVVDWKGTTAPAMTGDAFARLGAPAGASVSADIAAITTAVGALPTSAAIADKILGRNLAGGSDGGRMVKDALRFLRNKWSIAGGVLTVTQEDDSTSAWTATVSSDAAAIPIIGSDPT